jgi:hypothetical protein
LLGKARYKPQARTTTCGHHPPDTNKYVTTSGYVEESTSSTPDSIATGLSTDEPHVRPKRVYRRRTLAAQDPAE